LWITGKVDDTAIDESQTKFKQDFNPDLRDFEQGKDDFKGPVTYSVTVAPT